jgi:FkbM family methyltransferase
MRIDADDTRAAVTARASLAAGRLSRLWGQKGLGTILATLGRVPGAAGGRVRVEFEPGCTFELDPLEPYWGPTVMGGRPYEPELARVIERLAPLDPVFIDCGANFGYWSVVASGPRHRISRVLAIEPNPTTFAHLARNAALNENRFRCLERAVSEQSGERLVLELVESHAVARLGQHPGAQGHTVLTTRLEDAIREAGYSGTESFLVKLDVEGHEHAALRGAGSLASVDSVFVLEDFSKRDYPMLRQCDLRRWTVFYPHADGRLSHADSIDAVRRLVGMEHREADTQNLVLTCGRGALVDVVRRWAGLPPRGA